MRGATFKKNSQAKHMPVGITVPDELIIIVFKYTCILTLF